MKLQVLEQSYRNDPVTQAYLLSLFEGKTIDFSVKESKKEDHIIKGKIIRSGYGAGGQNPTQPIIEVDGKLQFSLPGEPRFDGLKDDTILNPTLSWKLNASEAAKLDAEIAYVTNGLSWHADYNIVAAETSDVIDLVGWVTFNNQSGKTFKEAKIKLMAGDVNRIEPQGGRLVLSGMNTYSGAAMLGDLPGDGKGIFRVPSLHDQPPDHAARP